MRRSLRTRPHCSASPQRQSAHAIVMCIAFSVAAKPEQPSRAASTLRDAATRLPERRAHATAFVSVDVSVVAFFVLFFVVRPRSSRVALDRNRRAAASAIPFGFGLAVMYRNARNVVPDPEGPLRALRSMAGGIAGVSSYRGPSTVCGARSRRPCSSAVRRTREIGEGVMGSSIARVTRCSSADCGQVISPERAGEPPRALRARGPDHQPPHASEQLRDLRLRRTRGGVFYYAMECSTAMISAAGRARGHTGRAARHILRQISAALS